MPNLKDIGNHITTGCFRLLSSIALFIEVSSDSDDLQDTVCLCLVFEDRYSCGYDFSEYFVYFLISLKLRAYIHQ